jgi:multicomponent K+:H+ antiporter subunit A
MLMLYSLSRIARYAGQSVNLEPMDYDPADRVKQREGSE